MSGLAWECVCVAAVFDCLDSICFKRNKLLRSEPFKHGHPSADEQHVSGVANTPAAGVRSPQRPRHRRPGGRYEDSEGSTPHAGRKVNKLHLCLNERRLTLSSTGKRSSRPAERAAASAPSSQGQAEADMVVERSLSERCIQVHTESVEQNHAKLVQRRKDVNLDLQI